MENISKAYKEVWEILKLIPKTEYTKVPKKFLDIIESNMDKKYIYKVEHIKDFENQEMLEETKALLAIFYRDYWATQNEKEEIIKAEQEELAKIDNLIPKYDSDALFKNIESNIEDNNSKAYKDSNIAVVKKERIYSKIFNMIKRLFRK